MTLLSEYLIKKAIFHIVTPTKGCLNLLDKLSKNVGPLSLYFKQKVLLLCLVKHNTLYTDYSFSTNICLNEKYGMR